MFIRTLLSDAYPASDEGTIAVSLVWKSKLDFQAQASHLFQKQAYEQYLEFGKTLTILFGLVQFWYDREWKGQ